MHRRLLVPLLLLLPCLPAETGNAARPASGAAGNAAAPYNATPTTPDQVFAQMQYSFRSDRARGQHLRYQVNLSDPQGGKWWIVISDGTYSMGKGTIDKPDVTFACTGSDWVQLSNGTLGGFKAFFSGRLKVIGNQFTAHKLDEIFP